MSDIQDSADECVFPCIEFDTLWSVSMRCRVRSKEDLPLACDEHVP